MARRSGPGGQVGPDASAACGRLPVLAQRRSTRAAGFVALGAVVGIAAAARWPNLWYVPTFTDEAIEIRLAYEVFHGRAAPLTNVDPYIGAFWNYLLALAWGVFGLSPWLPRLLAFVAGVVTVGAAWWLGREIGTSRGGPVGGLIGGTVAGLFMAGCSTHAIVNSHVAWSHATTPLWATLGLAFLARALRVSRQPSADSRQPDGRQDRIGLPRPLPLALARASGAEGEGHGAGGEGHRAGGDGHGARWLVGTGFFLGLAVQTHITALLLLPGIGLALLFQRPGLLRTRWATLAILAFGVATANLLAYNVLTGGGSLHGGQAVLSEYTGQDDGPDTGTYVENLGRLTLATSWILSGSIDKRRFVGETLARPLLVAYLGLAVLGLAWAARRGWWLPVLATLPYLLALPMLQGKYEPMLNGRYVVPVLPLVFASIGLGAADLVARTSGWPRWRGPLAAGAVLGVVGLAALYPLAPMTAYQRTARTNHPVIAAYEAVLEHRQPGEVVVIDYGLDGVFFMAAGSAYKSMDLLLGGSDIPFVVIDARPASVDEILAGHHSRLLVLNAEKVRTLGRAYELTALMGGERDGPGFGVFRVSARR